MTPDTAIGFFLAFFVACVLYLAVYAWRNREALGRAEEAEIRALLREQDLEDERARRVRERLLKALRPPVTPAASSPAGVTPLPPSPPATEPR